MDRLDEYLNKSARWIIFLLYLLLYVYFGSLIWGYFGIKTGFESIYFLVAIGALGGLSINLAQPEKKHRIIFILFAYFASVFVYLIGRWINFQHFTVERNEVVKNGALDVSQSILSDFSWESFMSFAQNSEQLFDLMDLLMILVSLYIVQYVTVKKKQGKHEDSNFHQDRKSRFHRKFDR